MSSLKVPPLPVVLEKPRRAPRPGRTLNTSLLMSRLKTSRRLARVKLPVAAAFLIILSDVSHGTEYLASVGPPELRFAPSSERGTLVPTLYCLADSLPKIEVSVAKPAPKTESKPAPAPQIVFPSSSPVPTNAIAVFPPSTNNTVMTSSSPPPLSQPSYISTDQMPEPPPNTAVTPEMFLDYLRPRPGGTGNATQPPDAGMPRPDFVPPVPVTGPSSRSVYKNE